jgi:hypothetical protein
MCTTTMKPDEKVWLVSTLSMKREAQCSESQLYITTLLGEVEEGYMGMYVPLALANVLDKF